LIESNIGDISFLAFGAILTPMYLDFIMRRAIIAHVF